MIILVDKQN